MMVRTILFLILILCLQCCHQEKYSSEENQGLKSLNDETVMEDESFNDTIIMSYKEADEYIIDTLIFKDFYKSTFLIGTQALPSSGNQLDAREFDICLKSVVASECNHSGRAREGGNWRTISKIDEKDNILIITVNLAENCCYSFLGDIGVQDDSTLNLMFYEYGKTHCACNCEFDLEYQLTKDCFTNENRSSKMKYLVINGKESSRKRIK